MKTLLVALALCCAWGCAPKARVAAAPVSYYVAVSGSDSNSCQQAQSASTPKATFASAGACLAPGDVLLVRGGVYSQGLNNAIPSGSSWAQPVRVAAYPGETVWLKPTADLGYVVDFSRGQSYVELDGLNIDASNQNYGPVHIESVAAGSVNTHHIRIQNAEIIGSPAHPQQGVIVVHPMAGQGGDEFINLTVHGGGQTDFHHGFYIQAPDVLIDRCVVYDWPGAGIQVYNGNGQIPSNVTIRDTTVRDLRATSSGQRHWGIVVYGGAISNTTIVNTIVSNIPSNGAASVAIETNAQRTSILQATLYGGPSAGLVIDSGATGTTVTNIISFQHGGGDYQDGGSGTIADHNLIGVDPLFVDPGKNNLRLKDGSPAIDAGATLAAVPRDVAGVSRPQRAAYDIGAYEMPGSTQIVVSAGDRLQWTQAADSLALARGYQYLAYSDGATPGAALAGTSCADQTPPAAGLYLCGAPFPAYQPGPHQVQVAASSGLAESPKSAALSFTFVTVPAAPMNLAAVGPARR